jgi:hypothetical protein
MRRGIAFECPACHSTLRCVPGPREKYIRVIVILLVAFFYAWKHGWDGGFVIFLLGFYGWVGIFVYLFFVMPFLPFGKVELVALPVSKTYLNSKPLSEEEYESRGKSIRPLGIT